MQTKVRPNLLPAIRLNAFLYTCLFVAAYIIIATPALWAQEGAAKKVYTFELKEEIMPAALRIVNKAMDEAEAMNADYVVMQLNTFGGMVDVADSIRTRLLKAKPVMVVWIDNNAASAGALISIACDSIYMAGGANIGAATVVNQTGEQMPDKYQSYMRSMMRSTAETQGRDPRIAEAMVDDRIVIEGIIDSGYTLTFTTVEAIEHGFAEGRADSFEEVMQLLGIENYTLARYEPGTLEDIISFLLHPAVNGILMLIIIGGLYFELQTPGVGFPLIASITAAILYFAPLYLEGLAENWEILVFLAGLGLLAVEIFVIPGFGVAGISGITLIVAGLTLSLIRNVAFDFSFTGADEVGMALLRVAIVMSVGVALLLAFGKNIFRLASLRGLVLSDVQDTTQGYSSLDASLQNAVGKKGIALTDLRPSGSVEVEDERYDAMADSEFIAKGTPVKVIEVRGSSTLIVKRVK